MPFHEIIRNSPINEDGNIVQTSCNVPMCPCRMRIVSPAHPLVSRDHPISPMFIHLVVSQSFFPCSFLKSLTGRSPDMVFVHYR